MYGLATPGTQTLWLGSSLTEQPVLLSQTSNNTGLQQSDNEQYKLFRPGTIGWMGCGYSESAMQLSTTAQEGKVREEKHW